MRDRNLKREIRVGIVTVAAIVALGAGILWGKRIGLASDQKRVTILVENASGVDAGTPVNLNGVTIGQVLEVTAFDEGAYIEALVSRELEIHSDATAAIRILELTGGKKIEIWPGESPTMLADGEPIPGVNQGDLGALFATASSIAEDIRPLLHQADSALNAVTEFVGDPEFQRDVKTTAARFSEIGQDVQSFIRENRASLQRTIRGTEEITQDLNSFLDRSTPALERTIANTEVAVQDARATLEDMQGLIAEAESALQRVDRLMAEAEEGDGLINRILYDKEFAARVESAMRSLDAVMRQILATGVNVNMRVGHIWPKSDSDGD